MPTRLFIDNFFKERGSNLSRKLRALNVTSKDNRALAPDASVIFIDKALYISEPLP